MNENNIQQQIYIWYNNTHCLKTNPNRGLIFSIPNGGSRNIREAMTLKATGILSGVSDLIVILPNGKLLFVEVKIDKGIQSEAQKDFENRVNALGYEYHLVRSLDEFKDLITTNNESNPF